PGSFRETQARRRGQMYEDQLNNGSRTAPQVQPELAPELRTSEARVLYADEVAGDNINLDDILERTQQRMSQTGADDLPEVDLDDVLRRTEQNMRGETPDAGPTLDDMIAETERRMNLSSSDELPEVDLEQVFARTQQDGPSHAPDEAPEFNLDDVFAETERRMREAADARGSDLDVQSQRSTQQLELEPGDYDFGLPRDLMTAPDDLVQRMYADAEVPTDAKIDIGAAINQRGEVRFDELQDILKRNGASEETLARYQVTEELVDSARERGIRYDSEPEASEATTSQSNDPGSQSSGGTQDGSGTGHGSGGRTGAREDAGHSSGPQPLDSAEGQSRQIAEGLDEMAGHQQDLDNAFYGEERPAHPQRQAGDAELSQQTSGQQSEGVTPQREMQANGPAADEAQALVDHHGEWPILEDVHTLLRNRQGDAVIADAEVSLTNRDIESAIRDAGYTREEALQMLDEFQAKSPQHADLPALRRIVDCAEGNFNTSSSAVSSDLELQTALMDINQKYQEVIEVANQYRQYLAEEGQYMNVSDLDDLIDVNLASQADQTRQLKVDQCDPADLAHQLEVHAKELELLKKVMKDQMDGGSWESNGGAPRRNPNSGDGDGGLATMTDVEVETSAVRQMFEEIAPSITGRVDVEPRRAPQGSPSGDSAPARQEEVAPARPGSDELDAPILGREESRALVSDVEAEMHQAMDIDADGLVVPARNRMRTPHWDPTYVRVPLTQTQTQALAQAQTTTTTTYRDTPGGRKPPKRRGRDYDSNSDESRAPTGDSSYQYFLKKSTSEQWRIDGIERLEVEVARRRLKRRS
ncbi:MAG: hypothetical protein KDD62_08305, partial [Bdellovibrionales bacterium]|nr:hypothetical protein [Bdellovibrionales bacterium]